MEINKLASKISREFFEDIFGRIIIPISTADILLDNGMILKQENKVEHNAYKGCFNANGVQFPYEYTAVRFSNDKSSKVIGYMKA